MLRKSAFVIVFDVDKWDVPGHKMENISICYAEIRNCSVNMHPKMVNCLCLRAITIWIQNCSCLFSGLSASPVWNGYAQSCRLPRKFSKASKWRFGAVNGLL